MNTSKSNGQVNLPFIVVILFLAAFITVAGMAAVYFKSELDAITSQLDSLKKNQEAIEKQLAEFKTQRLSRKTRSQPKTFHPIQLSTKDVTSLGDQDAPVTMVEFTDYQCPYCRKFSVTTLPFIIKDYVETGKLRYIIRELPVESRHPFATKASEAALCAGDQGRYWEMHDKLFENQSRLRPEDLRSYAQALGLNTELFDQCLENGDKRNQVQKDVKAGLRSGVKGTPTFFLGKTKPEDGTQFEATQVIRGAKTYPEFAIVFDELLAKADKENGTVK